MSGRAKRFLQVSKPVGVTSTQVLPPNPLRCGLILSAGGATTAYTFDGSPASVSGATTTGVSIGAAGPPVVLGEDIVKDSLTGPINAAGAGGTAVACIVEISYIEPALPVKR